MLKVSLFYLEKQKSFIPKKNIFLAIVNLKTNTDPIFSEGFALKVLNYRNVTISRLSQLIHYTANIYSGNWDTRKKCKSYKYLP